jgi:periplasmic protein TonB
VTHPFAPPRPPAEPAPPPAAVALARPAPPAPIIPPSPVEGIDTNRPPTYPPTALRRGEQGSVMLRVSVSPDGRPVAVDLAQTSGYPILDTAALAAVRQWRFNPAIQAGRPVAANAEVPVRFRLEN